MAQPFEPAAIGSLQLQNRFVRSATWEGMATENGAATPELNRLMAELAKGEVGLIISGHAYVQQKGQAGPRQLGAYDDKLTPGLGDMAKAVHEAGGKIALQLAHAGCHAAVHLSGKEAVAPSPWTGKNGGAAREISPGEIETLAMDFAAAALRAKTAGFDAVQIHAAHGYLLSQFLSPHYNHRTDEFGGSLENRSRALLAVYRAVRRAVGDGFPVLVKINSQDFVEGPVFTPEEMIAVSQMLSTEGIDAVEMSGGLVDSKPRLSPVRMGKIATEEEEGYYRDTAEKFKEMVDVPLILVGGIRSLSVARKLLAEEAADFVALSRPLIREPQLIRRWRMGDERRSECKSDNLCFRPTAEGKGIYCLVEAKENGEEE
jgi:2,4-dienoyl-CoA reductase-like NADH-dependent reductase (Old Yellow Enzyme family)